MGGAVNISLWKNRQGTIYGLCPLCKNYSIVPQSEDVLKEVFAFSCDNHQCKYTAPALGVGPRLFSEEDAPMSHNITLTSLEGNTPYRVFIQEDRHRSTVYVRKLDKRTVEATDELDEARVPLRATPFNFAEVSSKIIDDLAPRPALITPTPMYSHQRENLDAVYGEKIKRLFVDSDEDWPEPTITCRCPGCEERLGVDVQEYHYLSGRIMRDPMGLLFPMVVLYCAHCGKQHLCRYEGEIPF